MDYTLFAAALILMGYARMKREYGDDVLIVRVKAFQYEFMAVAVEILGAEDG